MTARLRPRLGGLVLALTAATALAACGDSGSSSISSSSPAPAAGCATAAAACSVTGSASGSATGPPACTGTGSGRTDDLHQAVTLTKQPDGLQTGDITVGTGPVVQQGQTLTVAYSGWLQDGTLFDSSRKPGGSPFPLVLGSHGVIPGFEETLVGMHVGGVRRAVIPPLLGYGPTGQGPIPPNATLTFDIEVLCAG